MYVPVYKIEGHQTFQFTYPMVETVFKDAVQYDFRFANMHWESYVLEQRKAGTAAAAAAVRAALGVNTRTVEVGMYPQSRIDIHHKYPPAFPTTELTGCAVNPAVLDVVCPLIYRNLHHVLPQYEFINDTVFEDKCRMFTQWLLGVMRFRMTLFRDQSVRYYRYRSKNGHQPSRMMMM